MAYIKARVKSRPSINSVSIPTCVNCAGSHNLATCEDFLSKSITQRVSALVKKKQASTACDQVTLHRNARASASKCRSRCTHCRRMHHSLLHFAAATVQMPADRALEVDNSSQTVSNASFTTIINVQNTQAEVAPRYFSLLHELIYILPKAGVSRS